MWIELTAVAVAAAVYVAVRRATLLPPEEARRRVDAGATLVDVRTPDEFARGHIEGARNIPVGEIEGRLDELGDRDTSIVVYCRSGGRSAAAKRRLTAAGFSTVGDLGGMHRWR